MGSSLAPWSNLCDATRVDSSVLLRLRPLVVVGKGAAFSQADAQLRAFVEAAGAPFLATAMGRGVVPDSHPLSANAARSTALRGADVAIVFGARCVLRALSADDPSRRLLLTLARPR